jgi:hypothetical protein
MRFMDRAREMEFIKEAVKLSKAKLFILSISGLRRVGKTRLILEMLKENDLYFFVNKDKGSESLLREYEDALKKRRVLTELESLKNWDEFFKILFERFKGTVAFDEFQNFVGVDRSVYGILQKYIDLNEHKKGVLFIFSGSTVGLVKKLFSDAKEPLYGRVKRKLDLRPLSFAGVLKMCRELGIQDIEEVIELYAIFGGFPKYYVSIEDEGLCGESTERIVEKFFFVENAVLEDEVSQILSLEFGKRSGTYYDILTAIADGNRRISEIASFMRKKETALTRQVNELVNYFELVGVEKPVVNGKSLLYIKHPLIDFWFRFFYKNLSSYKRREAWLIEKIKREINAFIGRRFETVCRQFLVEKPPFEFERVGRQWGKFRAKKGKNVYEIDILALNERKKEILFGECKWEEKVDVERVLDELKEKTSHVNWHNDRRREGYVIFAKKFKEKIKRPNLLLFDLEDLRHTLLSSKIKSDPTRSRKSSAR